MHGAIQLGAGVVGVLVHPEEHVFVQEVDINAVKQHQALRPDGVEGLALHRDHDAHQREAVQEIDVARRQRELRAGEQRLGLPDGDVAAVPREEVGAPVPPHRVEDAGQLGGQQRHPEHLEEPLHRQHPRDHDALRGGHHGRDDKRRDAAEGEREVGAGAEDGVLVHLLEEAGGRRRSLQACVDQSAPHSGGAGDDARLHDREALLVAAGLPDVHVAHLVEHGRREHHGADHEHHQDAGGQRPEHARNLQAAPHGEVAPLDPARLRGVAHADRELAAEEHRAARGPGAAGGAGSRALALGGPDLEQGLPLLVLGVVLPRLLDVEALPDLPIDLLKAAHAELAVLFAREDDEGEAGIHEAVQDVAVLAITGGPLQAGELRGVDSELGVRLLHGLGDAVPDEVHLLHVVVGDGDPLELEAEDGLEERLDLVGRARGLGEALGDEAVVPQVQLLFDVDLHGGVLREHPPGDDQEGEEIRHDGVYLDRQLHVLLGHLRHRDEHLVAPVQLRQEVAYQQEEHEEEAEHGQEARVLEVQHRAHAGDVVLPHVRVVVGEERVPRQVVVVDLGSSPVRERLLQHSGRRRRRQAQAAEPQHAAEQHAEREGHDGPEDAAEEEEALSIRPLRGEEVEYETVLATRVAAAGLAAHHGARVAQLPVVRVGGGRTLRCTRGRGNVQMADEVRHGDVAVAQVGHGHDPPIVVLPRFLGHGRQQQENGEPCPPQRNHGACGNP
mmetsp:Transcript_74637/g.218652  ORF Transcript_74637/g.218652 Transcript_74637/m.218652 type:complete len:728 (+) Transcript_74637:482-2665(+)